MMNMKSFQFAIPASSSSLPSKRLPHQWWTWKASSLPFRPLHLRWWAWNTDSLRSGNCYSRYHVMRTFTHQIHHSAFLWSFLNIPEWSRSYQINHLDVCFVRKGGKSSRNFGKIVSFGHHGAFKTIALFCFAFQRLFTNTRWSPKTFFPLSFGSFA